MKPKKRAYGAHPKKVGKKKKARVVSLLEAAMIGNTAPTMAGL
jgi:hypothetical protein